MPQTPDQQQRGQAHEARYALLVETATRVADWLERLAAADDKQADSCKAHLPAFSDACRRDAANRRATAKSLRTALDAASHATGTTP